MQTQPMSPGGAADAFYGWTIVQLILMGVAAALVIAGMIYGRRLAHQRHRAQVAAEERAEEAGIEPPDELSPVEAETIVPAAKEPDPDLPVAIAPKAAVKPKPAPKPKTAPAPPPAPAPQRAAQPEPATEPAPAPAVEPAIAGALALTTIKGLGPKVAAMLAERGITRVDQLAALGAEETTALDAELGNFTGRMARDRWIDQARLLASGDTAAYEAEFGKLG